ncbi:MAG: aminoacyl-tRNA hydrolase [Pyrinomonadaceae bacterium]
MPDATSDNWLIVGLGNPGQKYEKTRHNLGFMLVDRLAEEAGAHIKRSECRSLVGRTRIAGCVAELAKPQTYMNLSGEAVSCLLSKPDRSREFMIVISDDLALPFGTIRIRPAGSHGGQNGLRSIIDCLKTNEFIRLRIGIAPEHPVSDASSFVLEPFGKADLAKLNEILEKGADALRSVLENGVEKAMAQFN